MNQQPTKAISLTDPLAGRSSVVLISLLSLILAILLISSWSGFTI